MTFTTKPSMTWPGYTDIFEDGRLSMSVPAGQEAESIAYLAASHERHWSKIADRLAHLDPRLVLADDGHAYSIGSAADNPKGFGGDRWLIRFHDGREIVTDSLWHMGDIPADWRERLPENATLKVLR